MTHKQELEDVIDAQSAQIRELNTQLTAQTARAETAEKRLAKIDVKDRMTPYPAEFIAEMTSLEGKYNATYETDDTWIEMVSIRHNSKWVDIAEAAEKEARESKTQLVAAESARDAALSRVAQLSAALKLFADAENWTNTVTTKDEDGDGDGFLFHQFDGDVYIWDGEDFDPKHLASKVLATPTPDYIGTMRMAREAIESVPEVWKDTRRNSGCVFCLKMADLSFTDPKPQHTPDCKRQRALAALDAAGVK